MVNKPQNLYHLLLITLYEQVMNKLSTNLKQFRTIYGQTKTKSRVSRVNKVKMPCKVNKVHMVILLNIVSIVSKVIQST